MKKILSIFLCTILLLSGCGLNGNSSSGVINFFNWGDYIDPDIIKEFTDTTGIRVVSDYFDSNETMYAKIKNGGATYDLAIPSDYMIEKMINEDMLEKINTENIPNFSNIDTRLIGREYDPHDEYSVPYMWGTVGILYNKTMVSEKVDSWDIMWDKKYDGQIFMYESVRDSLGVALKKLGYSLNSTKENELKEARDILLEQKPLVQAYVGDTIKEKMIQGEGALAVVYSGDAMYCQNNNPELEYVVPKEGSNYWYDALVIPKGATHIKEAEAFINFLARPDIAAKNSEYIGYTTSNIKAFESMPEEVTSNPIFAIPDDVFEICEPFKDLGKNMELYDSIWTEVLASN